MVECRFLISLFRPNPDEGLNVRDFPKAFHDYWKNHLQMKDQLRPNKVPKKTTISKEKEHETAETGSDHLVGEVRVRRPRQDSQRGGGEGLHGAR